jgi:hypothetical protein
MAKEVNTPTISLNLRPYCNLLYPYETIEKVNKAQILADVEFWADVLNDIDVVMATNKPALKAPEAPEEVEIITKCQKCNGCNLVYSTGVSKTTGKQWYAFDCQDCGTERNGETYPTRNFTRLKRTVSASEGFGISEDEDAPW